MQIPRNIGGLIEVMHCEVYDAGTAADGAHDNTKVTNATGLDFADPIRSGSCKLVIVWEAAINTAETLSFTVERSECATVGGAYSTPASILAKTAVKTGAGSTYYGTYEIDLDCSGYLQFQKFGVTPDLSRSGTDTFSYQLMCLYADPVI